MPYPYAGLITRSYSILAEIGVAVPTVVYFVVLVKDA